MWICLLNVIWIRFPTYCNSKVLLLHNFNPDESVTTSLETQAGKPGSKQGPMSDRDSGHWLILLSFQLIASKTCPGVSGVPSVFGCSRLTDRWTNGGLDEELSKENILIWHKLCGGEREREISTWSKVQVLSFNSSFQVLWTRTSAGPGDERLWSKTDCFCSLI